MIPPLINALNCNVRMNNSEGRRLRSITTTKQPSRKASDDASLILFVDRITKEMRNNDIEKYRQYERY